VDAIRLSAGKYTYIDGNSKVREQSAQTPKPQPSKADHSKAAE
jgi:hypothetical protein